MCSSRRKREIMMNASDYYVKHGEKTYKNLLDIDFDIYDSKNISHSSRFIDSVNVVVLDDGIIKLLSGDSEEFKFIRKDGKDSE